MPSNPFYDSTGNPANNSPGNPATIRAEFDAIEDAFDKLPVLAGHASEAVFVNAGATALESRTAANARTALGVEAAANKDVSGGYVGLDVLKIKFRNLLNTFTSFLVNSNTAARTYTFPDDDGTLALMSDLPPNGEKNFIINGNFDIWQRDTTHTTLGYGSDDRWYVDFVGSTFTNDKRDHIVGQTTVPDNPLTFSRTAVVTVAGNGNFCNKQQRIEDASSLSGETVTLSFYAKADAPKNISVEFVQHFGTGGAPSADVTGTGVNKIAITADWALYTVTVAIPSVSGKTFGTDVNDYTAVLFWFDAGADFNARTDTLGQQNGIFNLSHVQLEIGSTASPFEVRHMTDELHLCLRYYTGDSNWIMFSGDVTVANNYTAHGNFAEEMRAIPSITLQNAGVSSFGAATGTVAVTASSVDETRTSSATGTGAYFYSYYFADAEL